MISTVALDLDIDLHGQMVECAAKSLQHTKKRLQEAELTLNLTPNDEEDPVHVVEWENKIERLLGTRDILPFPSRNQLMKERERQRLLVNNEKKNKKNYLTREMWIEKANRIAEKQNKLAQESILNRSKAFGSNAAGEVIRTIEPYHGMNTIYSGTRVLTKKEGNLLKENTGASSLPPWFHPQYYEHADFVPKKRDAQFQQSFNSISRGGSGAVLNEINEVARRKTRMMFERQHSSSDSSLKSRREWGTVSSQSSIILNSVNLADGELEDGSLDSVDTSFSGLADQTKSAKPNPTSQRQQLSVFDTSRSLDMNSNTITSKKSVATTRKPTHSEPKRFQVENFLSDALRYQQKLVLEEKFDPPMAIEVDELGEVINTEQTKPAIIEAVKNSLLVSPSSIYTSDIFRVKTRPKSQQLPRMIGNKDASKWDIEKDTLLHQQQRPGLEDVVEAMGGSPVIDQHHDAIEIVTKHMPDSAAGVNTTIATVAPSIATTTGSRGFKTGDGGEKGGLRHQVQTKDINWSTSSTRTPKALKRPAQSRREIVLFTSPRKAVQLLPSLGATTAPSSDDDHLRACFENMDIGEFKRRDLDIDGTINQWLLHNDVYQSTVQSWKGLRNNLKAELQAAATPVPTGKYSTAGLLLETNPLTANDELIRNNEGKELSEIVV